MNWIKSTLSQKPDDGTRVLILYLSYSGKTMKDKFIQIAEWRDEEEWIFYTTPESRQAEWHEERISDMFVTHWMPLPEEPKD